MKDIKPYWILIPELKMKLKITTLDINKYLLNNYYVISDKYTFNNSTIREKIVFLVKIGHAKIGEDNS